MGISGSKKSPWNSSKGFLPHSRLEDKIYLLIFECLFQSPELFDPLKIILKFQ